MQEVAARGGKIILVTDPQRRERGGNRIRRDADVAGHGVDGDAAGLCDAGAADRLSYGRRHRHRRRPAAQPRKIGHGGIRLAAMVGDRQAIPSDPLAADVPKVDVAAQTEHCRPRSAIIFSPAWWWPVRCDHGLADLVVHHLGGRSGAAVHSAGLPAGNLSAVADSGHRPDHRVRRADAARLPHRQFGRPHAGRLGRELLDRMPIVRPIYKTMKQIFETLFSKTGSSFRKVGLVEFPAPGMWSLVFLSQPPSGDIASAAAAGRACLGFPALHAQPDHRLFLLCPAQGPDRARHHGRERDDAADFRRHGAAASSERQKKLAALAARSAERREGRCARKRREPRRRRRMQFSPRGCSSDPPRPSRVTYAHR